MNGGEGPRMLHELLYTRFQVAPETIVYDNACNTAVYCLVREPKFYANTRFVVDRMHKKGHTHCPAVFDADYYPTTARANTQLVEQLWSMHHLSSASLMRMTQPNFVSMYKFCLHEVVLGQRIARAASRVQHGRELPEVIAHRLHDALFCHP